MHMIFRLMIYVPLIVFLMLVLFKESLVVEKIDKVCKIKPNNIRYGFSLFITVVIIVSVIFNMYPNRLMPFDIYFKILFVLSSLILVFLPDFKSRQSTILYGVFLLILLSGTLLFGVSDNSLFYMSVLIPLIKLSRVKDCVSKAHIKMFLTYISVIIFINCIGIRVTVPTESMYPVIPKNSNLIGNSFKYWFFKPKENEIAAFTEPVTNRVSYVKRIVGKAGQIVDFSKTVNGRSYTLDGFLKLNTRIYIPKKGDVVWIDKVYREKKQILDTEYDLIPYNSFNNFEEVSDYYKLSNENTHEYPLIFGNTEYIDARKPITEYMYTYTLKVEGVDDALVMPIYDFRTDGKKLKQLLNGEKLTLTQDYYLFLGDNTEHSFDSRYFGYVSQDKITMSVQHQIFPFKRLK